MCVVMWLYCVVVGTCALLMFVVGVRCYCCNACVVAV